MFQARSYFARVSMCCVALAVISGCASGRGAADTDDVNNIDSSGRQMDELFAGRFPGVEVSKAASGGINIRIRGANTILGNSDPLFIIDGVRVQSGPGGLLFLDPADIKRIEVLKDIGSTAIYGSEGANGVILITTKRSTK